MKKIMWFCLFYMFFSILFASEKLVSFISKNQLDYENTIEFPKAEGREHLESILGISLPRQPNSSWKTSPTDECIRYFRVNFKEPLKIGTIVGNIGDCEISYLKDEKFYPGDVNYENQWVKVEDVFKGNSFRAVVFPPDTYTRAIRFKFQLPEKPSKPVPSSIEGMLFLKERLFNIAPYGKVFVDSYERTGKGGPFDAYRLIDGTLKEWRNARGGKEITKDNPSWVILRWNEPRKLYGIYLVNVFGKKIAVDVFTGKKEIDPLVAPERLWKEIETFEFPIWWRPPYTDFGIKFDEIFETNAIRIRIIEPLTVENKDIASVTQQGTRKDIASIGEILVFENLGNKDIPVVRSEIKSLLPIKIEYELPEDSYVTMVVNDKNGKRVKNLVANVKREKGKQIEYWDGTDENGKIITPGEYTISGIYRRELGLKYLFSVYWSGKTPWLLPDRTGGWLSDHCAPRSITIVKDKIFIGALDAESGHGLMALDMNGNKLWGTQSLNLAGATYLTTDGNKVYVGSKGGALGYQNLSMVITELDPDTYNFNRLIQLKEDPGLSGIAVLDNELYLSYEKSNCIVAYDIEKLRKNPNDPDKAIINKIAIDQPGKIFICKDKKLFILRGKDKKDVIVKDLISQSEKTIIKDNLEDPVSIFVDENSEEIYISDWGESHQIKVFDFSGNLIRVIGKKGERKAGKYDPLKISRPKEVAIDKYGRLWVCEEDLQPKRISVWDAKTGKFIKEYIGGPEYGGGPMWLDPKHETKAYYKGMEFKLDWEKGTYKLERIYYRFGDKEHGHIFPYYPDRPLYYKNRKFMVYDFGIHTGYILICEDNGEYVKPICVFGSGSWVVHRKHAPKAKQFVEILRMAGENKDIKDIGKFNFSWSDKNGDGLIQYEEVMFYNAPIYNNQTCLLSMYWGSLMNEEDLSIAMTGGGKLWYIKPSLWTESNAPFYDLSKAKLMGEVSGQSGIVLKNGRVIISGIPRISGLNKDGEIEWTYPTYPFGRAAPGPQKAPTPSPKEEDKILGPLRVIGKGELENIGEFFAINGNNGQIYLISEDGLFFAKLFNDRRGAPTWGIFDLPVRGMDVSRITLGEECFGPTLNQIGDEFYIICGHHHTSIVKVEGLESIKKFSLKIRVTPDDIRNCEQYLVEKSRQEKEKSGEINILSIPLRKNEFKIDGELNDWKDIKEVEIKEKGSFSFSWDKEYFYFAANIKDNSPLLNFSDDPKVIFKGGDCIDFQFGLLRSPENNPPKVIQGDTRVLIGFVKNSPLMVIYKYIVPGTNENLKEVFSSPVKSVVVDKINVINNPEVIFKKVSGGYIVEGKIRWNYLFDGFIPDIDKRIPFDFGIIFSTQSGESVSERVYWSNKFVETVSDLPSEVEIQPSLWGWLILGE